VDGNRFASIKRPVRILGTWRNILIFLRNGLILFWECCSFHAAWIFWQVGCGCLNSLDYDWSLHIQRQGFYVRYIPTAGISLQTSHITQRFLLKPTQVHTGFYAQVNSCSKGSSREIQWFKA
jgi:hypothetical protein